MPYDFKLSTTMPAPCADVFNAWMSSELHAAMTGGGGSIDPTPGGQFIAWDGYVSGTTLLLEAPARIIQSWRTSEFSASDPDSQIELTLRPANGRCELTLRHSMVPDGHVGYEQGGWQQNYFEPTQEFFSAQ